MPKSRKLASGQVLASKPLGLPGKAAATKVAAKTKGDTGGKSKARDIVKSEGKRRRRKASPEPKGGIEAGPKIAKKRTGRPKRSKADAEAKSDRILKAALQVFSQHGFEAARLDEVARRAGVAKGTLYLYYPNKQAMFEALVHSSVAPLLDDLANITVDQTCPPEELLDRIFTLFQREILETDRKLIVRLIIAEGPRFPEIASFYHREVISRALTMIEGVASTLRKSGQLTSDGPLRYPQLIVAPLIFLLVWDGLFERIDPLDAKGVLSAHVELLTAKVRGKRR